ncbi:thioredoxin [Shigella flexneri]
MSYIKLEDGISLEDILKDNKVVIIDFWAQWCGPCKAFGPIFEEVAKEKDGLVKFVKVDVDKNSKVAALYNIRSIPTVLFIKDGQVVKTRIGAMPKYELTETVDVLLK